MADYVKAVTMIQESGHTPEAIYQACGFTASSEEEALRHYGHISTLMGAAPVLLEAVKQATIAEKEAAGRPASRR